MSRDNILVMAEAIQTYARTEEHGLWDATRETLEAWAADLAAIAAEGAQLVCEECLSALAHDDVGDGECRVVLCGVCAQRHLQEGIDEGRLQRDEGAVVQDAWVVCKNPSVVGHLHTTEKSALLEIRKKVAELPELYTGWGVFLSPILGAPASTPEGPGESKERREAVAYIMCTANNLRRQITPVEGTVPPGNPEAAAVEYAFGMRTVVGLEQTAEAIEQGFHVDNQLIPPYPSPAEVNGECEQPGGESVVLNWQSAYHEQRNRVETLTSRLAAEVDTSDGLREELKTARDMTPKAGELRASLFEAECTIDKVSKRSREANERTVKAEADCDRLRGGRASAVNAKEEAEADCDRLREERDEQRIEGEKRLVMVAERLRGERDEAKRYAATEQRRREYAADQADARANKISANLGGAMLKNAALQKRVRELTDLVEQQQAYMDAPPPPRDTAENGSDETPLPVCPRCGKVPRANVAGMVWCCEMIYGETMVSHDTWLEYVTDTERELALDMRCRACGELPVLCESGDLKHSCPGDPRGTRRFVAAEWCWKNEKERQKPIDTDRELAEGTQDHPFCAEKCHGTRASDHALCRAKRLDVGNECSQGLLRHVAEGTPCVECVAKGVHPEDATPNFDLEYRDGGLFCDCYLDDAGTPLHMTPAEWRAKNRKDGQDDGLVLPVVSDDKLVGGATLPEVREEQVEPTALEKAREIYEKWTPHVDKHSAVYSMLGIFLKHLEQDNKGGRDE